MSVGIESIFFDVVGDESKGVSAIKNTIDSLKDYKDKAEESSKATRSFAQVLGSLKGIDFKPLTKSVKDLNPRLTSLFNSLKRIATYRILRTVIKEITAGFREGMQNAYQYSKIIGSDFASSMDRLSTATLYLKNSLGALMTPIMNMLAPAIDFLIDRFVDLLNIVNQVFSLLSGAATWTKALRYPKEYAEAAGGATAKLKELRKTILGFDEINKLTKQSTPRGGSAADALDYSKMFTQADYNTDIKKFIDSQDWKGLGTYFGNRINDMINSIDWAGIGTRFAGKFNMIFQTAYHTLKTIDFQNLGSQIATLVSNAIENIDWETVGRLLARKITLMLEFAIGFLIGMNWGAVAKGLSNFIMGTLFEWSEWLQSVDWVGFATDLYFGLHDFISNVDWTGIIKAAFTLIGSALGALTGFLVGLLIGFARDIVENHMIPYLEEKSKNMGQWTLEGFLNGILGAIATVGGMFKWLNDNVITPFLTAFKEALGIHSPSTVLVKIGEDTLQGFFNGVQDKFNAMYKWLKEKVESIKKIFNFTWKFPEIQLPKIPTPHFEMATGIMGIKYPKFSGWYAEGGFPTAGDLFMANENGAELVGSMGNKTTVANNEQIIEGIRRGVQDGNQDEVRLLREQNDLLRQLIAKEGIVNIPLNAITNSLERKNQRDGGTFVPVG